MQFGPYTTQYPPGLFVKNISLNISQPITQFVGNNGVGKSVLLGLIKDELIAKNVPFAFTLQDYRKNWLWWLNPEKNLLASLKRVEPKADLKTLKENEIIKRQSGWLPQLLARNSEQKQFHKESEYEVGLSGGQLQRLILLRELLHRPKFLLLDEAFSALDKHVAIEIIDWLKLEQSLGDFQIIAVIHSDLLSSRLGGEIFDFELDSQNILSIKSRNE